MVNKDEKYGSYIDVAQTIAIEELSEIKLERATNAHCGRLSSRVAHLVQQGVKKATQNPIPISHPGPVLLSKFLNFCWAWWAHCVSR